MDKIEQANKQKMRNYRMPGGLSDVPHFHSFLDCAVLCICGGLGSSALVNRPEAVGRAGVEKT
jgi:hypothetical protein